VGRFAEPVREVAPRAEVPVRGLVEVSGANRRNQSHCRFAETRITASSLLSNLFQLYAVGASALQRGQSERFRQTVPQRAQLALQRTPAPASSWNTWCAGSTLRVCHSCRRWCANGGPKPRPKWPKSSRKVTAYYVSPQLCSQELSDVAHRDNKFKNMTVWRCVFAFLVLVSVWLQIKIIPSVREVIAIYSGGRGPDGAGHHPTSELSARGAGRAV
jgi:hypothetical protein